VRRLSFDFAPTIERLVIELAHSSFLYLSPMLQVRVLDSNPVNVALP
jgi:hypothetical protein